MNTTLKVRLVLLAVAFLFTASVTRAQNSKNGNSKPISSPSVIDSKGKHVGGVLGFARGLSPGPYPIVAIKIDEDFIRMGVKPSGFVDIVSGEANNTGELYESTNCSGTPYSQVLTIDTTSDNLFAVTDLIGTKVFVVDSSIPPKTITYQSFLQADIGCQPHSPATYGLALPMKMLVDLSILYTPPFKLK